MMKLKDEEVISFAVLNDQNDLLAVITEGEVATTKGYRVIAEKQEGDLAYLPMEDDTLKVFNRAEGVVLPRGTVSTKDLIASVVAQEAALKAAEAAEEKEEPEEKPEKQEEDSEVTEGE